MDYFLQFTQVDSSAKTLADSRLFVFGIGQRRGGIARTADNAFHFVGGVVLRSQLA